MVNDVIFGLVIFIVKYVTHFEIAQSIILKWFLTLNKYSNKITAQEIMCIFLINVYELQFYQEAAKKLAIYKVCMFVFVFVWIRVNTVRYSY